MQQRKQCGALRVAYISNSVTMGGMENHMLELARQVARLGCRVSAIVPAAPALAPLYKGLQEAGIGTYRLNLPGCQPPWSLLANALHARRLIRRLGVEVVHQHRTGPYHGKWACLAARAAGAPVVVATEHQPAFRLQGWPRWVNARVDALVDRIITVSEADRRSQIELASRPEAKVVAIHNGIDLARFSPCPPSEQALARRELGLDPQALLVGCAARLDVQKGLSYLLEATAILATRWPRLVVLLAGEGPKRAALEAQARALGIAERVHFLGYRPDVARIVRVVDLFVLPSVWESFGLAVAEAMALARPVVATRVGGLPEVVVDGETGLLAPPCSPEALSGAMARCLADPDLSYRLGQAGRRRVEEHFSAEAMACHTLALYEELLQARGWSR